MDMAFQLDIAAHRGIGIKFFQGVDFILARRKQSGMTGQMERMKERHRTMGCASYAHGMAPSSIRKMTVEGADLVLF
jgi:hypothetical protein